MTGERRRELSDNLKQVDRLLIWQKEIISREFAENYIYLPQTNSIGAGQLVSFKHSPHLFKMMEAFDDINIEEIWLMFASQMAKTLFLFICWAKNALFNPKTMVWMISKESAIQRYQREKITKLVQASEELRKVIKEGLLEQNKPRSKVGEIHHQGTTTYLIGSKTSDDKKGITTKIALVDEADEMLGLEDITPLQERTKTFEGRGGKSIIASTKKHKNGAITQGFNSCEQKNYLGMICPHCNKLIEMHFRDFRVEMPHDHKKANNIKDEDFNISYISEKYIPVAAKNAHYECSECEKKITTEQRDNQIVNLKIGWIKTGVLEKPKTIGFCGGSVNSKFVTFESMARKYLRALTEKDEKDRIDQLKIFYEGYVNEYYDEKRTNISKSDDILMLGSGLKRRELPDDTKVIYMTIDTQKGHKDSSKDHYWYKIGVFDSKMNFYKIESGRIYKDKDVYTKIFSKFNIGDKEIGIRRVLWDIQGHGEIETLALIAKMNTMIGTIPYEQEEKRNFVIYPYRGMTEIQNKTYRLQLETKKTDGLVKKEYPIILGNSKRGKDSLYNAISKSIRFCKGDEVQNPDQNMFWVDEDEIMDGKRRFDQKNNEGKKIPNISYEKQMTSEIYGQLENSKKEGWKTLYKGRDNHFWDCGYMMYILVDFDNLQERIFGR